MPIKVNCALCGKTLSAPDSAAGKKAKCPGCGQIVTVPGVAAVTAPKVVHVAEAVHVAATAAPSPLPPQTPTPAASSAAAEGETRQPCPECGEMIVKGAAKCRFCDAIFDSKLRALESARPGGKVGDLKKVASYQRGVILCILLQVFCYCGNYAFANTNPAVEFIGGCIILVVGLCVLIASVVFAVLVATRVFSTGVAVLLSILAFIPCLSIVSLSIIRQAATKTLRANGIKVGFAGADMSQF